MLSTLLVEIDGLDSGGSGGSGGPKVGEHLIVLFFFVAYFLCRDIFTVNCPFVFCSAESAFGHCGGDDHAHGLSGQVH